MQLRSIATGLDLILGCLKMTLLPLGALNPYNWQRVKFYQFQQASQIDFAVRTLIRYYYSASGKYLCLRDY